MWENVHSRRELIKWSPSREGTQCLARVCFSLQVKGKDLIIWLRERQGGRSGIYCTPTACHSLVQAVSLSRVPLCVAISILLMKKWATRAVKGLSGMTPSLPLSTPSIGNTPKGILRIALSHASVHCHILSVSFLAVTHCFGKCLHPT